jgi:hypothetical protein
MKPLPPITAKSLRAVTTDLGYKKQMPSDEDLVRRAAIFTAMQPQHDRPWPEFKAASGRLLGRPILDKSGEPVLDKYGEPIRDVLIIEDRGDPPVSVSVSLPKPHMLGHPRFDKTTWRHLLQDLAAEIQGMMGLNILGRKLGVGETARFLVQIIPLVTGEQPPFPTIRRALFEQAKALALYKERKAGAPAHMRERKR